MSNSILKTHETLSVCVFVRDTTTNLPGLSVLAKVEKLRFEPLVDLVQRQLIIGRFDNRLEETDSSMQFVSIAQSNLPDESTWRR